jgi:Carboxypeptidase regulatory-like domain/TonB dependent receptor-like, beta-barrel
MRSSVFSIRAGAALGVFLLVNSTPFFSQANTGRIFGTINDTSGALIPGVTVSITDVDRGTSRTIVTDETGAYNIPSLPPGTYRIRAELPGFKTTERPNLVLEIGKELKIDLTLEPGAVNDKITVSDEVPLVETASAVLGGTLQPGTIADLPLNGRNFMNLLQLRPGVTIYPGGGAWTQTTNGLRPEHNVYVLDGITAMEPLGGQSTINSVSLAGDAASLLAIDTIQEFTTQQNPKAEFGWKPGSVTSVALKSGTNAWHGTGSYFGRTDSTDARNPFLAGDQKQEIGLKEFGATFGGPIVKEKAFFFGAYEGQRYHVGNPAVFTYPSLDANALPIAGATTSLVRACNTVANAGTALSPTSLRISGLDANCNRTSGYSIFALPSAFERAQDSNGAASANVSGSLNTNYEVDGALGKVDLHPGVKHTLNGKYYFGTHRGLVVNNQTITQPYWRPSDHAWVHFSGIQWDYAKSSATVNTFRIGYNRFYQTFETSDCAGENNGQPDYGIPFGYGTAKPVCGFTNITLTNFSGSIGCCSSFPKYYGPDSIIEFIDNLSYSRGHHNFKMGGEFRNTTIGHGGTFNRGRGQVTFSSLENFMSGTTTSNGQIFIGDPRRQVSGKAMSAFFQDDWRLTSKLILNLGLRYEYTTPITEGHNQFANFDPARGLLQLGVNTDRMWTPDKNNFAPRLGFAYDISGNGRTVVRGGANVIFVTPGWWIFLSQQNNNNPSVGLSTNPSGFALCRGAVNTTGTGCANGVAADPTIGDIRSAGLPLPPATITNGVQTPLPGQLNWNQSPGAYGGNIYPSSNDTSVLKCGTNRLCTIQATDPNLRNAYVTSWSLGIQHGITRNLSIDLSYVGNHATKLLAVDYSNTPPIGAGYCLGFTPAQIAAVAAASPSTPCPTTITTTTATNATAIQLARPLNDKYPYYSYIYTVSNPLSSNYNGAQITLTQRATRGLSSTIGFTWSHALDQQTGERAGPNGTPFDYTRDYGSSDFDIRKRFTATVTYALPSKSGFGQLLQGWKLTSIVSLQSALPWGVIGSRNADPSGIAEFQDRWSFYGNADDFSGRKTAAIPYFLPGTTPPAGRSASDLAINNAACTSKAGAPGSLSYTALQKWGCFVEGDSVMVPPAIGSYGNMGRNLFRGNGLHTWDGSVMKDWKFGERVTGQFRAEVFNLLNQTQYGNPQFNGAGGNTPFGTPGAFGASQATPDVSNNNPSLGSGGPREFQFGFKVLF